MPPPTASDSWHSGRKFGIVIDAGSSGSRLQIYSWIDPRITVMDRRPSALHSVPKVEKGVREGEGWVSKVEPGISTFGTNPEGVPTYLAPLLEHARTLVPPSIQPTTPIFLLATAGMRLLEPNQQAAVLSETCKFLKYHSNFRIDDPSPAGPCGSSVRIITGEEEGLFGWIAVNYLMDGFSGFSSSEERTTYGFLDMGGASTQIAFEPSLAERRKTKNLINVRLRQLSGKEIQHQVFVTTWLGYGTNQARQRYVAKAINEYEPTHASHESEPELVPDPCLPKGLTLTETPMQPSDSHVPSHNMKAHALLGTGSFEECLIATSPLLQKNAPCPDSPCLFNGVHVPTIDFESSNFIGVSEYWYSSEHVFGLGGAYDYHEYEHAASDFCSQDWDALMREHEKSRVKGQIGGDGEVEHDGKVVATGKWGAGVEISRLQMQCFKAAWVSNVLHEGIGMPRIVDEGGESDKPGQVSGGDRVEEQAAKKGLGGGNYKPKFQSLDTVGDIAISWTLGKMVLEASKEVPLPTKKDRPLADPLEDMGSQLQDIQPIRPPFLKEVENSLEKHLPESLSRTSLGFSPLLFIYVTLTLAVFFVTYRVRRHVRASCRRAMRGRFKRFDDRAFAMEAGEMTPSKNNFGPAQALLKPAQRLLTSNSRGPTPIVPPPQRQYAGRISLKRPLSQNGSNLHLDIYDGGRTSTVNTSRSNSPTTTIFAADDTSLSNSVSSLSNMNSSLNIARSRNSSSVNLANLASRGSGSVGGGGRGGSMLANSIR